MSAWVWAFLIILALTAGWGTWLNEQIRRDEGRGRK